MFASLVSEDYVLQTARGDPGPRQRAAQKRRVHGEVPVQPQVSSHDPQNFIIGVIKVTNALHYQQENFEDAVQENHRAVHEQVDLAVAIATSRTAAHMTFRFRDIENHVEANLSSTTRIIIRTYFRVSSGT